MQTKFEFHGTGGELFKGLLKGWLLTGITFGIYLPWFVVGLIKLVVGKTTVRIGAEDLRLAYTGTGGELFKKFIVGYLLTMVTFGIYAPWFVVELVKFHQGHMTAVRDDGRTFRLNSDLTGGELFKTMFVNYLLTAVTFGIYMPWFLCNMYKLVLGKTTIEENNQTVATVAFEKQGGELLKTFIVGYLLTMVTFGIYFFWFQVKLLAFVMRGVAVRVNGETYRGDYTAKGGESFKLNFVGYMLTSMTFGIYGFWYLADLLRFQLGHTVFAPGHAGDAGTDSAPAPSSAIDRPREPSGAAAAAARALPALASGSVSANAAALAAFNLPHDPNDRRAPWARAFLTAESPAPSQSGAAPVVINVSQIALGAPSSQPRALPAPAVVLEKKPSGATPDIHETIVQSMHFPEYHEQTDRLAAQDPMVTVS